MEIIIGRHRQQVKLVDGEKEMFIVNFDVEAVLQLCSNLCFQ